MLVNGKEVEDATVIEHEQMPEPSLRESLQTAFKEDAEKTAAAAPDANAGETVEQRAQRAREANGQFAKGEQTQVVPDPKLVPDANAKTAEQLAAEVAAKTQQSNVPVAPRGWSPAAKVVFPTLSPEIQAEIHKREMDVDAGFAKYKGLDRHVTDFRNAGVEPEHAIAAYRKAEQLLVSNFDEGIVGLCQQFEKHPLDLAEYLVRKFLKPGEKKPAAGEGQQQQAGLDQETKRYLQSLEQRLNKYETKEQQKEFKAIETDIDSFLSDSSNRFADNVIDSMVDMIRQGKATGNIRPLKDVYDAACWLNPEVRQILIDEQLAAKSKGAITKAKTAATQARAAAASVTGKPAGDTEGASKEKTLRETIKAAFDEQRGSV